MTNTPTVSLPGAAAGDRRSSVTDSRRCRPCRATKRPNRATTGHWSRTRERANAMGRWYRTSNRPRRCARSPPGADWKDCRPARCRSDRPRRNRRTSSPRNTSIPKGTGRCTAVPRPHRRCLRLRFHRCHGPPDRTLHCPGRPRRKRDPPAHHCHHRARLPPSRSLRRPRHPTRSFHRPPHRLRSPFRSALPPTRPRPCFRHGKRRIYCMQRARRTPPRRSPPEARTDLSS
jgi:hypothetical protein